MAPDKKDLLIQLKFIIDQSTNQRALQSFDVLQANAKKLGINLNLYESQYLAFVNQVHARIKEVDNISRTLGMSLDKAIDKVMLPFKGGSIGDIPNTYIKSAVGYLMGFSTKMAQVQYKGATGYEDLAAAANKASDIMFINTTRNAKTFEQLTQEILAAQQATKSLAQTAGSLPAASAPTILKPAVESATVAAKDVDWAKEYSRRLAEAQQKQKQLTPAVSDTTKAVQTETSAIVQATQQIDDYDRAYESAMRNAVEASDKVALGNFINNSPMQQAQRELNAAFEAKAAKDPVKQLEAENKATLEAGVAKLEAAKADTTLTQKERDLVEISLENTQAELQAQSVAADDAKKKELQRQALAKLNAEIAENIKKKQAEAQATAEATKSVDAEAAAQKRVAAAKKTRQLQGGEYWKQEGGGGGGTGGTPLTGGASSQGSLTLQLKFMIDASSDRVVKDSFSELQKFAKKLGAELTLSEGQYVKYLEAVKQHIRDIGRLAKESHTSLAAAAKALYPSLQGGSTAGIPNTYIQTGAKYALGLPSSMTGVAYPGANEQVRDLGYAATQAAKGLLNGSRSTDVTFREFSEQVRETNRRLKELGQSATATAQTVASAGAKQAASQLGAGTTGVPSASTVPTSNALPGTPTKSLLTGKTGLVISSVGGVTVTTEDVVETGSYGKALSEVTKKVEELRAAETVTTKAVEEKSTAMNQAAATTQAETAATTESTKATEATASAMGDAAKATKGVDDEFSQFSDNVKARGRIVYTTMQQLGMSFDEAYKLTKNVAVKSGESGEVSSSGGVKSEDVAATEDQVRAYVRLRAAQEGVKESTAETTKSTSEYVKQEDIGTMSSEEFAKGINDGTISLNGGGKGGGGLNGALSEGQRKFNSFSMAFAGFELRFAGTQIARLGTNLLKSIDAYAKYMGIAEGSSAQILADQTSVQKSTYEIGRSLSQAAAPAMDQMAVAAHDIASIFQKYPILAQGTVAVAGTAIVAGNLMQYIGSIMTGIASLRYISPGAYAKIGSTVAAVGATQIGGVAISAIAAAAVSALPYILVTGAVLVIFSMAYKWVQDKLAPAVTPEHPEPNKILGIPVALQPIGEYITVFMYGLSKISPIFQLLGGKSEDVAKKVADMTGTLQDFSSTLTPTEEEVNAYIQYLQAVRDADQQYQKDRKAIIDDANKQILDNNKQFSKNLAGIEKQIQDEKKNTTQQDLADAKDNSNRLKDFAKADKRAEEDYYISRAKESRNYNIEVQRAEEDHQRRMQQMQADHNLKVQDLLWNNDAFGLLQEKRSYEKSRKDEEDNYAVEARRRSEDFANRIADMEAAFRLERARRIEDFALQAADTAQQRADAKAQKIADLEQQKIDLEQQHKDDLARIAADQKDRLKVLDDNHITEINKLQANFNDQLRQLDAALLGEQKLRAGYYQAMSTDLTNWLTSFNNTFSSNLPKYPGKAGGGYTAGIYRTGEEGYEFVLTHPTTRHLERAVRGRLTQENVLQAIAGGRGSATINQNFRFNGDMSAEMKQWYRKVAYDTASDAISDMLG